MTDVRIRLEVDLEVGASDISLADRPVATTREFNDAISVDLDELGVVVGIEVLGLATTIPYDELARRYHIHSDVLAAVNLIRPSVGYFAEMHFTGDSSTSLSNDSQLAPA